MRKEDEMDLYDDVRRYKPKVLVMAPQCTGMAGWGRFNAVMNPIAHEASASVSRHLGEICAMCALKQVEEHRHYFCEQPRGSDLYQLPTFILLSNTCAIWCYMDMCMVNLRSQKNKRLLKKPSELWASHELLLYRFRRFTCDGNHLHDTIEGGRVSQLNICGTVSMDRLLLSSRTKKARSSLTREQFGPRGGRLRSSANLKTDTHISSNAGTRWCDNSTTR